MALEAGRSLTISGHIIDAKEGSNHKLYSKDRSVEIFPGCFQYSKGLRERHWHPGNAGLFGQTLTLMPDTWSVPRPMSALPEATIRAGPHPQPLMLHSGAAGLLASSASPSNLHILTTQVSPTS